MKIVIGSDHGGFVLKNKIKEWLLQNNHSVEDVGCDNEGSCDYPMFGKKIAEKTVADPESLGIAICGSGVGISMAANKIKGARCALCNSVELAKLAREHNGANVLALGARTAFLDDWKQIVEAFLATELDTSERHQRRREQLNEMG